MELTDEEFARRFLGYWLQPRNLLKLAVIVLGVAPVAYAISGESPFSLTSAAGTPLVFGLYVGLSGDWVLGLVIGMAMALIPPYNFWAYLGITPGPDLFFVMLEMAAAIGFCWAVISTTPVGPFQVFVFGTAAAAERERELRNIRKAWRKAWPVIPLVMLALVLFAVWRGGPITGLISGLGLGAGVLSGGFTGWYVGQRVGPGLVEFARVGEYLNAMTKPVLGFAFGYLLIVLWFAGLFASTQRWAETGSAPVLFPGNSAFNHLPDQHDFGEFLYFSIVTAATVGYGDITPASSVTKILASVEIVSGLGWTVVVFGSVIAYLTPRFAEIAVRHRPKVSDEMLAMQHVQETVRQIDETLRALQASRVATVPRRRPWWAFWRRGTS